MTFSAQAKIETRKAPTFRKVDPYAIGAYPAPDMPFELSFIGTGYFEVHLIASTYAYEQRTRIRIQRKAIPNAIPRKPVNAMEFTDLTCKHGGHLSVHSGRELSVPFMVQSQCP